MKQFLLISVLLFSVACNTKKENANEAFHIVATTGMLYDAVVNIAGDKMTYEVLMGPGVDPHLYKATQGDLSKLNRGDLIVYNGIRLEGKMDEILKNLSRKKPTIGAAESLPDSMLLSSVNYENAYDPHIWFDVKRWKYAVNEISRAIIDLDSANLDYYKTSTAQYLNKLDSLDLHIMAKLSEIPENQRILVTAHDAFGYFGEAYGLRVEALQGISTVSDFGLKDIANLIDLIIDNNIKAIFIETSVSEKSINAVVRGCQEKGHNVSIGGQLYSDAMGTLGTAEGTYIGMFKKNVETIVEALK